MPEEALLAVRPYTMSGSIKADATEEAKGNEQMCECRICLEEDVASNMVAPCACKGSQRFAHDECMIM
jgi:E3 ubiquitin-protein ligase DOA10